MVLRNHYRCQIIAIVTFASVKLLIIRIKII